MKKGQIQINETMIVIFIFTVMLVIGFVSFFKFTISDIKSDNLEYEEKKAKWLIEFVPNMYELRLENDLCIDSMKAEAFSMISESYSDLFGLKKISIVGSENVVLYNGVGFQGGNSRKYSSPVCVYNSQHDIFSMAKLEVEWYG